MKNEQLVQAQNRRGDSSTALPLDRRAFLQSAAFAAGALAMPGIALAIPRSPQKTRARALRLAHLTDFHIQPEKGAFEGVTQCLSHLAAQKDQPDLVLTGGDFVMDSLGATDERAKVQWDLLTKVFKDHCALPVQHCIGNHDCWGWHKKNSKTVGDEPLWGKKRFCDALALPRTYHAFTKNGWKFIVLDSIDRHGEEGGYIGKLDAEQLAWLKSELTTTPAETPFCVSSHIPIMSMCAVSSHMDVKNDDFRFGGGAMHLDGLILHELFKKHKNVKVCLSGHIHLLDRVEMDGVTYICCGAVSGSWWTGKKNRSDEGYSLVDFYDDGAFGFEYVPYGWVAKP